MNHEVNLLRRSMGVSGTLVLAMSVAVSMVSVVPAEAAGSISKFVIAPHPIGTATTTAAGVTMNVTVTALSSTNVAMPGATEYLSFSQAIGGGTAFVGTTALIQKPEPFVADASGKVVVTYSTPSTYPGSGVDSIKAENGPTMGMSTTHIADSFCYAPITSLSLVPKPIARTGSLAPGTTIPVTLTAFGPHAARLANGTVWVTFRKANGGGSASVGGVALTPGASKAVTTNSSGQVTITYTSASVLPVTGADRIVAGDAALNPCISVSDSYIY